MVLEFVYSPSSTGSWSVNPCFIGIQFYFQAASQNTNDNSDGWDNSGDWGEPTQDPPKMVETKKQDSWGEFEDWLSDEKSTAKKD